MNIEELLTLALSLSQSLLQKTGMDVYQSALFQGIEVPELNLGLFEMRVMGTLKSAGKLSENTRLYKEPFDFNEEILGMVIYLVGNDRIDIHTAKHLNKCKERLVLCKELCQIYLDLTDEKIPFGHERQPFKDIQQQIFDLIIQHNKTAKNFDQLNIAVNDHNRNEFLSFFVAVNLIFPLDHRSDFKKLYGYISTAGNGLKLYDIAYAYRMPQFALQFFKKRMLPYYGQ